MRCRDIYLLLGRAKVLPELSSNGTLDGGDDGLSRGLDTLHVLAEEHVPGSTGTLGHGDSGD
jgi:hypothetical protein